MSQVAQGCKSEPELTLGFRASLSAGRARAPSGHAAG